MEDQCREPEHYGKARSINEVLPKPCLTGLEGLSEQELSSVYLAALEGQRQDVLRFAVSERKRRYIGFAMEWYRNICRKTPKTESSRLKCLSKANEIFLRGWHNYHDELISLWQYVEEAADEISEGLPECATTVRYKASKRLMKEMILRKVENMQGKK